jgi:PPIC-type PPIASE domain
MSGRAPLLPGASVLAASLLVLSCQHAEQKRSERSADENAALGGEVAARVGDQPIPLSVIASVAQAQKVTAQEAVRKVVDDEIAASAARSRGIDQQVPASWRLVSTRARFASDRFFEEAKRKGLPSDEEVRILSERHWAEVDCPPTVSVVHAIVLHPKDPALAAAARSLSQEIRAVVLATGADELEAKVKAVPHDSKLDVRVEQLPPFTEDGWIAEGGGRMDTVFSKAAYALPATGATSDIVETGFGFHVIRLLERLPEKRMPMETRRLAFAPEVNAQRAGELMRAQLASLRAAHPVEVSPAAEQLMRTVKVSDEMVGTP